MNNSSRTQTSDVERWLLKGHGLTSFQAIKKYGATRLSDIIFRLRKAYNIVSVPKIVKNRYGTKTRIVTYFITRGSL